MEVTGWDDRTFFMIHTFVAGDRIVAEGTSSGVIGGKEGVVPPVKVTEQVERDASRLRGESCKK